MPLNPLETRIFRISKKHEPIRPSRSPENEGNLFKQNLLLLLVQTFDLIPCYYRVSKYKWLVSSLLQGSYEHLVVPTFPAFKLFLSPSQLCNWACCSEIRVCSSVIRVGCSMMQVCCSVMLVCNSAIWVAGSFLHSSQSRHARSG